MIKDGQQIVQNLGLSGFKLSIITFSCSSSVTWFSKFSLSDVISPWTWGDSSHMTAVLGTMKVWAHALPPPTEIEQTLFTYIYLMCIYMYLNVAWILILGFVLNLIKTFLCFLSMCTSSHFSVVKHTQILNSFWALNVVFLSYMPPPPRSLSYYILNWDILSLISLSNTSLW